MFSLTLLFRICTSAIFLGYENSIKTFYFVAQTLTTVGYGDMPAISDEDMIFTCFLLLLGGLNVAIVLGNMTSLFVHLDATRTMFKTITEEMEEYMTFRDLPQTLREQVRRFYDGLWIQSKGRIEEDILNELPTELKKDVMVITRSYLDNVPIFRDRDAAFLEALRNKMSLNIFVTGDIVLRKGFPVAELWLVSSGEIHVLGADQRSVVDKIKEGEHFGLTSLFDLKGTACKNNLRAGSYVEMYVLSKISINEVQRRAEFRNQKSLFDVDKTADEKYLEVMDEFNEQQEKWHGSDDKKGKKQMKALEMDENSFKPKWWVVKPHAKIKSIWDVVVVFFVIYFSLISFFRLSFAPQVEMRATVILDVVLELILLVDSKFTHF